MPCSRCRVTFSMTTIASSTTNPVEIVNAVTAEIHHTKRTDQRNGYDYGGNQRRAWTAQKHEDDDDDQTNRNHQRAFDFTHRSPDRRCLVRHDAEIDRRWNRRFELR